MELQLGLLVLARDEEDALVEAADHGDLRRRLLLRLDRIEEAATHLASLSQTSPDPRPALWHVECLYRLRRFDELRKRIEDPRLAELALTDSYGNVNPVLNLWQISSLSNLLGDVPELDAPDPVVAT